MEVDLIWETFLTILESGEEQEYKNYRISLILEIGQHQADQSCFTSRGIKHCLKKLQ